MKGDRTMDNEIRISEEARRLNDFINHELDKEAEYRKPETAEEREAKIFEWIMGFVHEHKLNTLEICKGDRKTLQTFHGTYPVQNSWRDLKNLKQKMEASKRINVDDYGSKYVLNFRF